MPHQKLCLLALIIGFYLPTSHAIEYKTLIAKLDGPTPHYSEPLILAEGDMAEVIFAGANGNELGVPELEMKRGDDVYVFSYLWTDTGEKIPIPKLAGPCTLRVKQLHLNSPVLITFAITRASPSPAATVPANAAVIPEDASGQFQVVLESSTDTLTWTPAMPGQYGGSTQKRFFRTRIIKTN